MNPDRFMNNARRFSASCPSVMTGSTGKGAPVFHAEADIGPYASSHWEPVCVRRPSSRWFLPAKISETFSYTAQTFILIPPVRGQVLWYIRDNAPHGGKPAGASFMQGSGSENVLRAVDYGNRFFCQTFKPCCRNRYYTLIWNYRYRNSNIWSGRSPARQVRNATAGART